MVRPKKTRKTSRQHTVRRGPGKFVEFWEIVYRYRIPIVFGLFVVLPAFVGYLGYLNELWPKVERSFYRRMAGMGFAVQDILVEGRERTSSEGLLSVIRVRRGDCLLQCDPHTLQVSLKKLPWIQSAAVERRWPDVIYVRLAEHTPLALWQNKGQFYLIDQRGSVIRQVAQREHTHLPVLVGKGAPGRAAQLLTALENAPPLPAKMKAAVLVSERRWDLVLEGFMVKLPYKDLSAALKQLAQMERDHRLSHSNVTTVDLRLADRSFLYVADKR